MKLTRINISHYGPLPIIDTELSNFNLFYGDNEIGKTMTIEAIYRILTGKEGEHDEEYCRVEHRPSGYILLENNGDEIKITDSQKDNTLAKIMDLDNEVCKNLVFIHNSQLKIDKTEEFYDQITAKLTGIKTKPIGQIKENLLDNSYLTESGDYRNTKREDKKLKDRISNAKKTIKNIKKYVENKESEGFTEIEFNLADKRMSLINVESKIGELNDARNRERYEKGKNHLITFEKITSNLKELVNFNSNDKDKWTSSLSSLNTLEEQKSQLLGDLKNQEDSLNQKSENAVELNKRIKKATKKKEGIDNIKEKIKILQEKKTKLDSFENNFNLFKMLLIFISIVFPISLISLIFQMHFITLIFTLVSGIWFFINFGLLLKNYDDKKKHDEILKEVHFALSKIGIFQEEFREILYEIEQFENIFQENKSEKEKLNWEINSLKLQINDLKDKKIVDVESNIKIKQDGIEEIKKNSQVEHLEQYAKKIEEKTDLEKEYGVHYSALSDIFEKPKENNSDEKHIEFWNSNLKNYDGYKDKALGITWDLETSKSLTEQKALVTEEIRVIEQKLDEFKTELRNYENAAKYVLLDVEESIICDRLQDLVNLKDTLQEFIDNWELKKKHVLIVYDILNMIEAREREQIAKIFNDELLKETFSKITDGNYTDISYNPNTDITTVTNRDGRLLPADKLSSATFDQLYFSIRLAFSKKVLSDKTGFFIMDDPFIRSDINRLHEKLRMLLNLSEEGWQILYFTAKKEVMDFFEENNLLEKVKLISIS